MTGGVITGTPRGNLERFGGEWPQTKFEGDWRLSLSMHSGTHPLIVTGLILSHYFVKVLFSPFRSKHHTGLFRFTHSGGCFVKALFSGGEKCRFRWDKGVIRRKDAYSVYNFSHLNFDVPHCQHLSSPSSHSSPLLYPAPHTLLPPHPFTQCIIWRGEAVECLEE